MSRSSHVHDLACNAIWLAFASTVCLLVSLKPPEALPRTPLVTAISNDPQVWLSAAHIVQQGNGKGAAPCEGCHGLSGEGNAALAAPRLAGLPAHYLEQELDSFAGGHRQSR